MHRLGAGYHRLYVAGGGGLGFLLDYKSNHINRQNTSEFIQNYQAQIELYAQAIREIWQEPLKAAYLYLFHTERAIEMKITE